MRAEQRSMPQPHAYSAARESRFRFSPQEARTTRELAAQQCQDNEFPQTPEEQGAMRLSSRRLYGCLALSLLLTTPARNAVAQGTGVVRGTVTDASTHQPITGAQVRIAGASQGSITDADGNYRLTGVPAGTASIVAQRVGFTPQTRQVNVNLGASNEQDFTLVPVVTTLSQVVVVGYGTSSRA